jgi:hypothetical protein
MAEKEALIIIPEDREKIAAGETIELQLLSPDYLKSFPNRKNMLTTIY